MCGIIGYASREPIADMRAIVAGSEAMRHRGPDSCGQWIAADRRVALAHRRLAIIDLSPGGHQPMVGEAGELVITFNGEIYNYRELRDELAAKGHRFRTASDTEVVLAAYREWELESLGRLNGMFALGLYDVPRRRVLLARDRAGEKPLHYRVHAAGLTFASELKALLADASAPRIIDPESLDCFLAMGYVPGDRSILRGYRKLPPAHALVYDVDSGAHRTWRFWSLPDAPPPDQVAGEAELLDGLERLLEDAVRRQLVSSDVPVGVLLSGGVDSSLITAMAVRAAPHVKTFTVRFSGAPKYDESAHARLIAQHFQTDHYELDAEASTSDLLPILARQYDEPMVDSSMIPTFLVSRLIRQHCTVAIGGDGGDELFGGYDHYRRMLRLKQMIGRIPHPVRRTVAAAHALLPWGFKGRNWLHALGTDYRSDVPPVDVLFDASARRQLLAPRAWQPVAEAIRARRLPRIDDLYQRASRMDFENYLAEDILVKVDRASMLNSLEVRAPFLDHRVIEFAFGRVPSHLKASPSRLKILLKQLAARVLPPAFDQQRKQGFSIPLNHWLLAGPWADSVTSVLLDSSDSFFDRSTIERLLEGQRKGRNNGERVFALALFELWRREYGVML